MMKYCKHCGKELHPQASFCPYCMENQVDKQIYIPHKKKSNHWIAIIIGLAIVTIVIVILFLKGNMHLERYTENEKRTEPAITTSITTSTTTIPTMAITTTEKLTTSTTTSTETISTAENTTTSTAPIENTTELDSYYIGDYMTEGKSYGQIHGYGSYENLGGIVLTFEESNDNSIIFSLVLYSESGLASETISARNITAEIIDNTVEFKFSDMLDGAGAGTLILEDGKIHITTWADETARYQTSIIVDQYLVLDNYIF